MKLGSNLDVDLDLEQKHLNVIQTSCCLDPDVSCVLLSDYDNIIYDYKGLAVPSFTFSYLES